MSDNKPILYFPFRIPIFIIFSLIKNSKVFPQNFNRIQILKFFANIRNLNRIRRIKHNMRRIKRSINSKTIHLNFKSTDMYQFLIRYIFQIVITRFYVYIGRVNYVTFSHRIDLLAKIYKINIF